jgi:hypothetical protein
MAVRIFSRRIELMRVVRVLDRADAKTAGRQVFDQLDQERRFAVILAAENVDAFHGYRGVN